VDAPPGEVVFSIPAPTPKMLEDILPKLAVMKNNENKVFSIYLRAGTKELESLKKIRKRINFRKTTFCIGVEFPSDRMLKIMDKGVTLQEYINMINFIQKNDGNGVCYFITGWPEIEESDVKEAEYFFSKIPLKHDRLRFIWGRMIKYDTVIPEKKINSNVPMVMVKTYKPALTDKYKIDCNQRYIDVLNKFNCIERIVDNPERKLPVIDKENLYRKYVLPLEK
jgi:hypothetical protein